MDFLFFLVTSVVLFNIGPRNTESNKRFIRFGHETEAEPYNFLRLEHGCKFGSAKSINFGNTSVLHPSSSWTDFMPKFHVPCCRRWAPGIANPLAIRRR